MSATTNPGAEFGLDSGVESGRGRIFNNNAYKLAYMTGDTSIRLSRDAKERLDLHKRDDESYNDVILRLASTDRWAGFGVASGDPEAAREGMAELRDSMRESIDRDVEPTEDETDERGNA